MELAQQNGEAVIIALLKDPRSKERGFAALMALYQKQLYVHIRRMLEDHADTDDALQTTLIKAWRFLENFRGESSLKTWIWRIATNECLTVLAKRKRRNEGDLALVENSMAHSAQNGSALDGDAMLRKLSAAVERLPDKQKQVFVMKYYEDMKYGEMVAILGGTEGSLKASFHHAVKKIELYLQGD